MSGDVQRTEGNGHQTFLIFFGICAAAFVIGWWVVPTAFVNTVPEQTMPKVDLSYQFECEIDPVKCAEQMAKMSADTAEYSPSPTEPQIGVNDLIWTGRFPSDQITFKSGEALVGTFS